MNFYPFKIPAILLAGVAGFCLTRFWPMRQSPVLTGTDPAAGLAVPTRADRTALGAAERFNGCLTDSAGLAARDWPAFFVAHAADELIRPALMEGWIARDPSGFWKWIKEQKDASLLTEVGPRLFGSWAMRDAGAAFAATGEIASAHLRDRLRALVLETVLAENLDEGMALAARCGPIQSSNQGADWILKDPLAAVQKLSAMSGEGNSFRWYYLRAAARILARQNPTDFVEWLESAPRLSPFMLNSYFFSEAPAPDARRLLAAVASLRPGTNRDEAMRGALIAGAEQLPEEELVALAMENLTGWERSDALADAAKATAFKDPAKAAGILAAIPASQYSQSAVGEVTRRLAATDWDGARAWIDTLADVPVRRGALEEISQTIPAGEAARFAASIAALPEEEWSDNLLRNVHAALTPGAAAQWIASLPEGRAAWVREVVTPR